MLVDDKYSRPIEELHRITIDPVEKSELEKLNTRVLLKRLAQLRACTECLKASDWTQQEFNQTRHRIAFKNTDIWRKAWADVKSILATREHVERGNKKGSKQRRREQAWAQKHR